MDIPHIRYFLEVAKQESFSAAAQQLYVTQPILTRCVKNLEKELGVQLIDRSTRRFALTDAGRLLVERGTALLQQHSDIYRQMEDMARGHSGEIHISSPGALLEQTEQLQVLPVVQDEVHVLLRRDHPLAAQPHIHISQLAGQDIITYDQSNTLHHTFVSLCRDHGFSPNIVYQSMMPGFIFDTLSYGDCIGVFPAPMLRQSPRPELVSVPLRPHFPWQIAVITNEGRYLSRAAESFLRFTRNFFPSQK